MVSDAIGLMDEGTKLVGVLSMRDVVIWLMSAQKATIDNLLLDYHGLSRFEKFGRLSLLG